MMNSMVGQLVILREATLQMPSILNPTDALLCNISIFFSLSGMFPDAREWHMFALARSEPSFLGRFSYYLGTHRGCFCQPGVGGGVYRRHVNGKTRKKTWMLWYSEQEGEQAESIDPVRYPPPQKNPRTVMQEGGWPMCLGPCAGDALCCFSIWMLCHLG